MSRCFVSLLLITAFLSNALPCGPGWVTPLFDTHSAPENPYVDFAAGKLGILKPKFRRSVLYAAYRYITGSGLNALEQQSIVDLWRAEISKRDPESEPVDAVIKDWVEKRKAVVGKDEKVPDIYTERSYGGYDFFPNCTKNAFEVAGETLAARVSSNGATDPNVANWLKGQDQVFENCTSGRREPEPAPPGAPEWLQKDREYQMAAASFYSLNYADAKRRFAEIAQDSGSPWQETADYLVARTLIRQASLAKSPEKSAPVYDEAQAHLEKFVSRSGKFAVSAAGLSNLIKYRRHPQERLSELGKTLAANAGSDNFKQDLVDYTWLLDKFESEILAAEDKRKEAEQKRREAEANSDANSNIVAESAPKSTINNAAAIGEQKREDDIAINLSTDDYSRSWTVYVDRNATDEEALTEAARVVGDSFTNEMKDRVREARRSGYASFFNQSRQGSYEGNYYGQEKLTTSLMTPILRKEELTDWLFTFQMNGPDAYLYSLRQYRGSGSELWLMTALAKAEGNSTEVNRLLEAAANITRTSPASTTIAFHSARILLAQGKSAEARRLVDEMLDTGDQLTISARNSFMDLKLKFAQTLEDFLSHSLRKPFAFDLSGRKGTIDEFIAEQKTWYNPETDTQSREAYEAEIEESYRSEKVWQDRLLFDTQTIEIFNHHFPTGVLIDVLRSPALPDYMRERMAVSIWTRAYLLNDAASLAKVSPDMVAHRSEFEPYLTAIANARTPTSRENALMYFVLKNPVLSPYVEDSIGKTDNEFDQFDANDWWCTPYDNEYNDETGTEEPKSLPPRPAFLKPEQSRMAQTERQRLKAIGDAPKYLADKVLAWAKRNPADKRVPEALYIVIGANGWTKYGCGTNEELRLQLVAFLKKQYPQSEWTAKLIEDEAAAGE